MFQKVRPKEIFKKTCHEKYWLKAKFQTRENFQENSFTSRFHRGNLSKIYKRTKLIGELHHVIKKANLHALKKNLEKPPHKHISHRKFEQHLQENQNN